MKIALIGYGKMGHIIEEIAKSRGHKVVCAIDIQNQEDFDSEAFRTADVAIEFTTPKTCLGNVRKCLDRGMTVVVGSTGWYNELPKVEQEVKEANGALFWASNFSIGGNLDRKKTWKETAAIWQHEDGSVDVARNAEVGTAFGSHNDDELEVVAFRRGEVPGIHTVTYDSDVDTITMTHSAKSRRGFALGAVVAAEWMGDGKKGVYTMEDLMKF